MSTALTPRVRGQDALAAWLLKDIDDADLRIVAETDDERAHRLRAYHDAYRLRLMDVLRKDFPLVRDQLGDEQMDALALQYLQAHPSTHPSVRHLGRHLAGWLVQQFGEQSLLAELARLEWAQGEVFDAPDHPACALDELIALAPQDWPQLRVRFQSGLRVMVLRSNAMVVADAHARQLPIPLLCEAEPTVWLFWRQGFDVHWREIPRDEHLLMSALHEGRDLQTACARLSGDADPALRMAALLKRWLLDELVIQLQPHP